MLNKFVKVILSKWSIIGYLTLLILFIMPANSPVGIPRDFKVIPVALFVLVVFWLLTRNSNRGMDRRPGE